MISYKPLFLHVWKYSGLCWIYNLYAILNKEPRELSSIFLNVQFEWLITHIVHPASSLSSNLLHSKCTTCAPSPLAASGRLYSLLLFPRCVSEDITADHCGNGRYKSCALPSRSWFDASLAEMTLMIFFCDVNQTAGVEIEWSQKRHSSTS